MACTPPRFVYQPGILTPYRRQTLGARPTLKKKSEKHLTQMKSHIFSCGCGLLLATAAAAQERPNVIFLVADDLGYGDLSCYGAKGVSTPHTDSLAREGVLFTDAHAVASTSTPSRYSLLTGQYAFRRPGTDIAAGNAGMIIHPEQYTLADLFRSQGYHTYAVGKWHLGLGSLTGKQDWNGTLDQDLHDLGFDHYYIMAATADRTPCVYIKDGRVANYDPSAPIYVSYQKNFEGEPTGASHPELLTKLKPSHGHDQSIVNGISRIGYMKGGGRALWRDEDIADSIITQAIGYMEQAGKEPFFMYLCTNDVHVPRYPHERFRGKSPMGLRGEAILQFDYTVGQITAALRRLGLAENTLIVLTSDNGPVLDDGYQDRAVELCGDHRPSGPFRGGKYSTYEAGTTVPFIVSWPGHTRRHTSRALVSHIDAMASMAALLGTELPDQAGPDSRDYLNTWLGRKRKGRDHVVEMSVNRSLSVRQGKWKYTEPSDGAPRAWQTGIETGYRKVPQLFDLKKSVYEQTNVFEQHPERGRQLQQLLEEIKQGRP